jgi:hypothetical protein
MDEIGQILDSMNINPVFKNNELPSKEMTNNAVEAFFHVTGSLLHLWDYEDACNLIRSVYHPGGGVSQLAKIELFAISAVGSYCDSETMTTSYYNNFLHFLLSTLSSHVDISALCHMRLFTCLAICRFTEDIDSARKLVCE